jgi:uncharacterized protein (TIGR03435 family)
MRKGSLLAAWSFVLGCAVASYAQAPLAFDVATVKRNVSGDSERSLRVRPGQLIATNVTLRHLIWNAFNLQDFEVSGGPGWLATERFDVVAKSDRPNILPNDLRSMLRALLEDRFKLRARVATVEAPRYALVMARTDRRLGAELVPTPGPCDPVQPTRQCGFNVGAGTLAGSAVTIPRLAQELTGLMQRRVVDRSGLDGLYRVRLQWAPTDTPNDVLPSLVTAVQEQLGLKLESERGPVEMLVIDGAERPIDD